MSLPYWLDEPAQAYPPLAGDEHVDVAVVGGGVTGLACARLLAEAGLRVRVLEARAVGSGASGRNGGFALRGTACPYDALPDAGLMRATEEAVDRLAELAGDAFSRTGSLRAAADADELAAVRAEYEALRRDGFAAEWVERADLPHSLERGFLGALYHPRDGALAPGTWARRLAALAVAAGVRIAERTRALSLAGASVRADGAEVTAAAVVLATDGYTQGLVPELDGAVEPARAQMLATEPLPRRLFPCPVYARYGWDYWQQARDGRLLVGGCRDADPAGERTRDDEPTEPIQARLEDLTRALLGRLPAVTHRWAGLLGLTADRLPLVGPLPGRDGVWAAVGYSGHGNALALAAGEAVAAAILGRPAPRLAGLDPGRLLGAATPGR